MTLPTLLWYIAFCFIPLFGIIIAFKSYRLIPGQSFLFSLLHSDWVGLQNFRFMFLNPRMSMVIRNTIGYNLLFLITDTVLPIAFAIGLSRLYSGKLAKLSQTAALLPHFISWVAISPISAPLTSDTAVPPVFMRVCVPPMPLSSVITWHTGTGNGAPPQRLRIWKPMWIA